MSPFRLYPVAILYGGGHAHKTRGHGRDRCSDQYTGIVTAWQLPPLLARLGGHPPNVTAPLLINQQPPQPGESIAPASPPEQHSDDDFRRDAAKRTDLGDGAKIASQLTPMAAHSNNDHLSVPR